MTSDDFGMDPDLGECAYGSGDVVVLLKDDTACPISCDPEDQNPIDFVFVSSKEQQRHEVKENMII